MPVIANRARMTTATTGTGTLTLGSAVDGYQTFTDAGISDGNIVRYVIEDGSNWEIGTGTYTASGTTLTRTVIESNNADAAINLSGSAEVFIDATAEDIVQLDETQTLTNKTLTSPSISDPTFTGALVQEIHAWTTTTGAVTGELDPANGTIQTLTLTGNITSMTDNMTNGETLTLYVDDGTAYTITWPTMTWLTDSGSAPTLKTSGYTVVVFEKHNNTLYGWRAGDGG